MTVANCEQELIPWDELAVLHEDYSPQGLHALKHRLVAIPLARRHRMAQVAQDVFSRHFSSVHAHTSSMLAAFAAHAAAQQPQQQM